MHNLPGVHNEFRINCKVFFFWEAASVNVELFLYVQIVCSVILVKKQSGIFNAKTLKSKPVSAAKQKAEVHLNSHLGVKWIFLLNSFFLWSNRVCSFKLVQFFCLTSSGLEVRQGSYNGINWGSLDRHFCGGLVLQIKTEFREISFPFLCGGEKNLFSQVASFPPRSSPPPWIWRWNIFFFHRTGLRCPWHFLMPDVARGRGSKWGRELQNAAGRQLILALGVNCSRRSCCDSIKRKVFALFGEARAFTHKSKPLGLVLSRCEKGCCENFWPRKELEKLDYGENTELGLGSRFASCPTAIKNDKMFSSGWKSGNTHVVLFQPG